MNNSTIFKPGQVVWVSHFYSDTIRNKLSAKISEREFYRYSTPSYAKGELRAVVGPKGKAQYEGGTAPFGTAYKPAAVFATREEASADLARRMDAASLAILALRHEVCGL